MAAQPPSDEQGWTHVPNRKGASPKMINGVPPLAKDVSPETLWRDFQVKTHFWRTSSCRREILSILEKYQPMDGWDIQNAICIATNSFSRDNWQARRRSMMQLVAFVDICQNIHLGHSGSLPMSAQEPNYTAVDQSFLEKLGISIMDARKQCEGGKPGLGEAGEELRQTTFLFEPFMDLSGEAMDALFSKDPALYIGASLRRILGREHKALDMSKTDPQIHPLTTVRRFAASRISLYFPRYEEDPSIFEGLAIYWREPDEK